MSIPEAEERLSDDVLAGELGRLEGWERSGPTITRTNTFKGFKGAMAFANRVADAANAANHHPDIHIESYNQVRVVLTTHASGGISRADIELARAIDAAVTAPAQRGGTPG
ncbi:MAG: 4a-hydroxytetrahydrobiopterin dehydratase [Chloroflexota bacterium]|nr:4a-hydroxytetrahydrobiopterin dehydratase [Chloroflexota bacterium]